MANYRHCHAPCLCVCIFPSSRWLSCLHLNYSTLQHLSPCPTQLNLETQTICPFRSFLILIQEYENGGYCSTENAIRERRAHGPELSHEDFTKFHEVWSQCNRQPTHFFSSSIQCSEICNHIPSRLVIYPSNFHSLVFHHCMCSAFFISLYYVKSILCYVSFTSVQNLQSGNLHVNIYCL